MSTVRLGFNEFDFDAVVDLMDDDIRKDLESHPTGLPEQEFVDAYCREHERRFGKPFVVN